MKVDIILPVFKGKKWVAEAIGSVLKQTYKNWHLTVIDDASPDDTASHVRPFCQNHPGHINLITLSTNRKAAGARMEAIQQTSGDIIAFLDQDDRWLPEKLDKQVTFFERNPQLHANHTDVYHINPSGDRLPDSAKRENKRRSKIPYDRLSRKHLSESLFLHNTIRLGSSVILRKEFESIGGYNEDLFGGEDWEFWVRFATRYRIGHIPEPLIERRIHDKNTSSFMGYQRSLGLIRTLSLLEKTYPHFTRLSNTPRYRVLKKAVIRSLEIGKVDEAQAFAKSLTKIGFKRTQAALLYCISHSGVLAPMIIRLHKFLQDKFKV